MAIDNIHDKFFKDSFSRKEAVIGLIEEFFPIALRTQLNLESLVLTNNSFTDENLNEHFADLVYSCEYNSKSKLKISLLFEHKSYQEKYPHLQLFRYLLNVWEQDKKEKNELTLTIPIIIYHGKRRWKYEPFSTYFKRIDDALKAFIPTFDYLLFDISQLSDNQIISFKNHFLATALILLKNSRENAYLTKIKEQFINLLRKIDGQNDLNFIESILVYTLYTHEGLTKEEIIAIFRQVSTKTEQITMSVAELIKKEGKIEGKIEGKKEGKIETTLKFVSGMLKMGMEAPSIAAILELPASEVEKLIIEIKNNAKN